MSEINDGGPAFPVHEILASDGSHERWPHDGMTLRDYFIAHAPAEPQPWFEPTMPHPRPVMPAPPQFTEEEKQEYREYNADALQIEQVESVRLAAYLRARVFHSNQSKDWNADYDKQRYIQWPRAWADAMLKARTA